VLEGSDRRDLTRDYGGTVNEMTGDGIVALFGAPVALEDAPQRATRAALAIHRAISSSR
jgi:class 3 adenylate cyclase